MILSLSENKYATSHTTHPSLCAARNISEDAPNDDLYVNLFSVMDEITDSESTDGVMDFEMLWGEIKGEIDTVVKFSDTLEILSCHGYRDQDGPGWYH
jgi:hypothetical protein